MWPLVLHWCHWPVVISISDVPTRVTLATSHIRYSDVAPGVTFMSLDSTDIHYSYVTRCVTHFGSQICYIDVPSVTD